MKFNSIYLSYKDTHSFSKLVEDYTLNDQALEPFIQDFPSTEALRNRIENKKFADENRLLLHEILYRQYEGLTDQNEVVKCIDSLKSTNTFTISAAHQPVVFTGSLYFMYKIIHAIKLAEACRALFPEYQFVPVFFVGSEDNDLDEIATFHYEGQRYRWPTNQTGACGRMLTTDFADLLKNILATLNTKLPDELFLSNVLTKAYDGRNTLSRATRIMLHELFGEKGLVVVDGDEPELKRLFQPVMHDELFLQRSKPIVDITSKELNQYYKVQANPREINLFYLKDSLRERIEKRDGQWEVLNSDIRFSEEQLLAELECYPERFSPNVILRPLYQERILPNIAFIGGGGELAYWMQLKRLFDHHHIEFPLLFLRNSVLWIAPSAQSLIQQLGLSVSQLFMDNDLLTKQYLQNHKVLEDAEVIFKRIGDNFDGLRELGEDLSPKLGKSMLAHRARALRVEERMRQKFVHLVKENEAEWIHKLHKVKEQVSPGNALQERHENFMTIYKLIGREMFRVLFDFQSPFSNEFLVITIE